MAALRTNMGAHVFHNASGILRYPLDVALDQVGLGSILLLVAKQPRPAFGTIDADGLVAVDDGSGFGLGIQMGGR